MDDTNMLLVWIAGLAFASTLFTVCSLLILAACRKSSAAMRCKLNMLAVVGLAVLPALSAFSPKLSLGWLTLDFESQLVSQTALSPKPPPALNADPGVATNQVPSIKSELATLDGLQKSPLPEPIISQPPAAQQQERVESSIASAVEQPILRDSATSWLAWLLAGYAAGVVVLAGRLCVELAWAIRIRQLAEPFPVGTAITRRLRPGGIGELQVLSADVPVPMVVGAFRPAILVPGQAETWSAAQLTSALSHELAHIDRKDLPMQLFCSLVRCFYWPQPLVHILLGRLRADTELACDHLAVSQCSQPAEYARHLLSIATECIHPPRALSAAVPMFRRGETHRGDLETRVAAVLSPTSEDRPKRTWLLAAMLFFCLFFSAVPTPISAVAQTPELATNGAEQSGESFDETQASTSNGEPGAKPKAEADVWRVSGTVVDSRGNVVPNVSIVTERRDKLLIHSSSDTDGQFVLEIPKTGILLRPYTWFYAPGHGVRATLLPMHEKLKHGDSLAGVVIPLPAIAERPLQFRILDPNGKPLAGATVRPHSIDWPNGRFMADEPTGLSGRAPKPVSDFLNEQSDATGRVAICRIPAALMASVVVESQEYGLQEFVIWYREPGEQMDLRLKPAAALTGRLLAPSTANLEGIKLEIRVDHDTSEDTEVRGLATVRLTSTGEFSIPKLPIQGARHNLHFIAAGSNSLDWDPSADFQPAFRNANIRKTEQGYDITIPTVPTVLVRGVVKATDTNRPLSDVHMSFRNPSLRTPSTCVATDQDGVFQVKLPAGKNTNQIFAVLDREELGKYACATTELQVPAMAAMCEAPAVYLAPLPTIAGVIRDMAGSSRAGVQIGVRDPDCSFGHFSGLAESQADGRFKIRVFNPPELSSKRLQGLEWFEIVKPAEGTQPRVLRKLEVLDRDPTATVLRQKE